MLSTSPLTPCLFIAHGTPMNALEENRWTRDWQELAQGIEPKAVVVISAHWCSQGIFVASTERPATIHDFGGFPQPLYEQQYPCPGSPKIAEKIQSLSNGYKANLDKNYGLDHGAWVPLMHLFPQADVPCLQLSLDMSLSMQQHFEFAQQLKPLREQGVLFIGSGNIVHNIQRWMRGDPNDISWARDFDQAVVEKIAARDFAPLLEYSQLSEEALQAVPHPDHYLPLIYTLALSEAGEQIRYSNNLDSSSLEDNCMRSMRIG